MHEGPHQRKRCGIACPTWPLLKNTYTVQIGSAIGTHVGPGAPSGRLLGAGDLHLVSRVIPGSWAMAVPHGAIYVMTLARIIGPVNLARQSSADVG